ncbi:MAG: TRAP transporter substrate-binding protein DctP [Spirochaetaceae bacterium]|jgi:TRAP-type C4-dicarboxylate transport system substrate-binding protein|nr:TRAP transporter substrate-binding protein DctP [Spirochaetaceae bacterium]
MHNKLIISILVVVFSLFTVNLWAEGQGEMSGEGANNARQQRSLTIKVASIVPNGTPWQEYVDKIATDWKRISEGKINMVVYHGSQLGKYESDILTQMKIGQIQGAIFTSIGMGVITPKVMTMSYPLLIRNEGELDTVLARLQPELEAEIEKQGYHIVAWSKVGWVKFFARTPVLVPNDLRNMKLATGEDLKGLNNVLKNMGFNLVNVSIEDTLIAMNSGTVDATYQSPIAIGASQVFGVAKHMTDFAVAPFMGGLVVSERVWKQVEEILSPEQMDELMKATKDYETRLNEAVEELESQSVKQMQGYGLIVHELSPEQREEWYKEVATNTMAMEATDTFDQATFAEIEKIVDDYRKNN